MIVCSCCNERKPESEYYKKKNSKGEYVPRTQCKRCVIDKKRDRQKDYNSEYEKWFKSIPKKCERCGETRPYMIDFHHLEPAIKEIEISKIKSKSWNIERKISVAKKEMEKCIQLCANCHREFHYLQKNFEMDIYEYI